MAQDCEEEIKDLVFYKGAWQTYSRFEQKFRNLKEETERVIMGFPEVYKELKEEGIYYRNDSRSSIIIKYTFKGDYIKDELIDLSSKVKPDIWPFKILGEVIQVDESKLDFIKNNIPDLFEMIDKCKSKYESYTFSISDRN